MKKGSLIDRSENIWNVPNLLTMLRMVGVAVFIALFAAGKTTAAMVVFILAACTDALDGYIARKYHLITSFGKLMDPLADKLMTLSALVCLTVKGLVPEWLLAIVASLPVKGWLQEKLKQGGNLGQTILIWAPKGLALGLLGLSYLKLVTSSFNPFIYFQF